MKTKPRPKEAPTEKQAEAATKVKEFRDLCKIRDDLDYWEGVWDCPHSTEEETDRAWKHIKELREEVRRFILSRTRHQRFQIGRG